MKQRLLLDFGHNSLAQIKRTDFMKIPTERSFDVVKFMREQREKLSEKLSKMTKEEIVEYFKKRKQKDSIKPSK